MDVQPTELLCLPAVPLVLSLTPLLLDQLEACSDMSKFGSALRKFFTRCFVSLEENSNDDLKKSELIVETLC
jgi:hypothetical protein